MSRPEHHETQGAECPPAPTPSPSTGLSRLCLAARVSLVVLTFGAALHSLSANELHSAVRDNDLARLATLLETAGREEVNAVVGANITPLHMASALNAEQAVALLLIKGADPDARTMGGFTPLHWAASRDAGDAARLLLQAGADVHATTHNGITPLHWAAGKNATNTVKLLIGNGADADTETRAGLTPLHWAVLKDASDTALFLAFKTVSEQMDREEVEQALLEEQKAEQQAQAEQETPDRPPPDLPRPVFGKSLSVPIGFGETLELVWIEPLRIWIGKYEVTNGQYRRFEPDHDSLFRENFSLDAPNQPVVYVSWSEAAAFCNWLNRNYADRLPLNCAFRLPTEREWIAVARCGDNRRYPWGDRWPPAYGNFSDFAARKQLSSWVGIKHYDDGFPVSCPVSESGENEWGIFGLAGNVWEWCADWFSDAREYKVRQGGSWDFDGKDILQINARGFDRPDARYDTIGFRVVVSLQPE